MLILNVMPIFLLTFNAIFGSNFCAFFLLCMPDYVLEGSKGTPFEGKDHAYYIPLSFYNIYSV